MNEKNKIYELGKTLGLDKKDIDKVLSAKPKTTETVKTPAVDMYKAGTKYGTISHLDLYKGGILYGTISPKELYKAGTRYGTISPNDLL